LGAIFRPGLPLPGEKEDRIKKALKILVFILICELAGIIGSLFTSPSIPGWYAGLVKPPFNPPSWVFAPVWTILYALMGLSAYLVYEKGPKRGGDDPGLDLALLQDFQSCGVPSDSLHPVGQLRRDLEHFLLRS
jgi:hypothetical protein